MQVLMCVRGFYRDDIGVAETRECHDFLKAKLACGGVGEYEHLVVLTFSQRFLKLLFYVFRNDYSLVHNSD